FFYRKFKINAVYKKYCPTYENLGEYISYFKENGFLGFNVTVPYKQVIIKYLDYIHPDAEKIGAVNTVKIVDGKLYGYNTDGDGFCMQIKDIKGKDVKIIGAGGSVLSVVHCLIKNGAKSVTIYNRTLEKAKVIADLYDNVCAKPLDVFSADNCQILINAVLLNVVAVKDLDGIEEGTEVFDVNYNKKETEFIKMALKYNVTVKNGLMMLVNQGLLAHKIWFGKEEN
ncbi:MAG: shikimate dehydrogenase, partial [Clostridia bacterium]|nr:shikimate dehydrogenase [Clostridia bacterium]